MMQVQWVVKTTPLIKHRLLKVAANLSEGDGTDRIAARLLVEIFDLKRTQEMKERGI